MKRIFTAALFMAAAYMITGCVRNDGTAETGTGRVKVSFSAQSEHIGADSRAIIDDGYESGSYTGSWEDGDAISVVATLNGVAERATFTYDSQTRLFTGYLTAGTGERTYRASYPASDTDGQVPFGRERTQGGNGFNSSFDAMASATIDAGTSEAGVGPDGAELTFNLKHLTAIVAAHLTTSGAAASEPVKAITLTSDSAPVSASALTFGESTATALHTDGQSRHVIALFGESSTATASEAKAFFNIPEGEYGNLTVSVITENHRADITVDRTGKPLTAGKLYYLNRDIAEWTETPAPSAVWIGNESFEPMELTSDMDGLCHLAITVPSGIRGMKINIDSGLLTPELLQGVGLAAEMDMIDNAGYAEALASMGLTTGDDLVGLTDVEFNLDNLVPLILMLSPTESGDHVFTLTATDLAGRTIARSLTFHYTAPANYAITYNNDADLWNNTASLTISGTDGLPQESVAVEYRASGEQEWQTAAPVSGSVYSIAPSWTQTEAAGAVLAYKTRNAGTGVFLGQTYEYRLTVDGEEVASGSFSAGGTADAIPYASMDQWCTSKGTGGFFTSAEVAYPNASSSDMFWANGNNKNTSGLCTQDSSVAGFNGTSCALLKGDTATGNIFAPGNLFSGTMEFGTGFTDMFGYASFGQQFTYSGRPSGMKVRYKATVSKMTHVGSNDPDKSSHVAGETTDPIRIMFCITDWSARHRVKSGVSMDTATFWDPEKASSVGEGAIIGYGSLMITESTAAGAGGADGNGWVEAVIPLRFYDTEAKPSDGSYSFVFSASSSAYGDYLTGSTDNILYIEDMEWVY